MSNARTVSGHAACARAVDRVPPSGREPFLAFGADSRCWWQAPTPTAPPLEISRPPTRFAAVRLPRRAEEHGAASADATSIRAQEAFLRAVRHSITDGHLSTPKNHEKREVHLSEDVIQMLEAWYVTSGSPTAPGTRRVPRPDRGHPGAMSNLRTVLYPAMVAAGVDRAGPTGTKRTFHSLRHTYAKRALENGRQVTWLSTPPRALLAQGHDGCLWPLGSRRAQTGSRRDGRGVRCLTTPRPGRS